MSDGSTCCRKCVVIMSRRLFPALLFVALLGLPAACAALSGDRDQPIRIEADSVEIDDVDGVSIYRGNVVYAQGSIRLEADAVFLFYDDQRKIRRLEATGAPVRFRQRPDGEEQDMRATAGRMEYFADPERLVLEHDAYIWRQDVEFTGDYISYDIAEEVVKAGKEVDNGRVHIVIQPRQESPGESNLR